MKLSTINESLVYKHLIDKVHGVLRSKRCLLCLNTTQEQLPLCHACKADLPYLTHCCQRCALPLQHPQQDLLCGQCLQNAPLQARTLSLFSYQTPVAQMLSQLKFQNKLVYSQLLGSLLAEKLDQHFIDHPEQRPDAILCVPLSRKRLAERGFNQVERLALPLAKQLELPILQGLCERIINTDPQQSLAAKARSTNMRQAFRVTHSLTHQGKVLHHIAVFDDVITTGATLNALSQALKDQGLEQISWWSIARTPLKK